MSGMIMSDSSMALKPVIDEAVEAHAALERIVDSAALIEKLFS